MEINNGPKGGKNRDWGYASYNVDDNSDDLKLTYTSYEKSGRVNRYTDNGDGGHSHSTWDTKESYDSGESPSWSREDSGDSSNPSDADVQDNGGCYLTTACLQHFKHEFRDDCYELSVLRWFRDNFISKEEIKYYYRVAPLIVKAINKEKRKAEIYEYIYDTIVEECVQAIENGNYKFAYN